MSALRDILEKMYVEDELLNQLDDEQKQILFIKMREEQIRRWNQREAELDEQEKKNPPKKKKNNKRIQWLKGRDGEVWVWVMGAHPNDPSIDDIIEDEARLKARELAEIELANDRNVSSGAVGPYPPQPLHPSTSAREEQLKQELRSLKIGGSSSSFEESSKASSSDDTNRRVPSNEVRGNGVRTDKPSEDLPYYTQLRRSPPEGIELEDGRRLFIKPPISSLEEGVRLQMNGSPFRRADNSAEVLGSNPRLNSTTQLSQSRSDSEPSLRPVEPPKPSWSGNGASGNNFVQRFLDEHDPKRRASREKSPVKTPPTSSRSNVNSSTNSSPSSTPRQNSRETPPVEFEKKNGSFLVGKFTSRQSPSPTKDVREDLKEGRRSVGPDDVKQQQNEAIKKEKKPKEETKEAKPKTRRFLENNICIPRIRRDSDDKYYANDENSPRNSPLRKDIIKPQSSLESNSSDPMEDKIRINGDVRPLMSKSEKKGGKMAPPPVPEKPSFLSKKKAVENGVGNKDDQFVQSVRSYTPGHNPTTTFTPQQVTSPSSGLKTNGSNSSPKEPVLKTTPTKPKESSVEASSSSSKDSSDTISPEMLRLRQAQQRLEELLPPQDELEKRQSLILEKLMEEHQRLKEEAEKEAERERLAYEEQKRKSREAEAQIRAIAQKAREQHEKNLRTSTSLLPMLHKTHSEDLRTQSIRDAVKNIPRPPKPKDRAEIIHWFKKNEGPQGAGIDPWTKRPFIWFHGILSRPEADNLLANQPPGAFIVRISERIWGYTISYVVGGPDLKHFLVERIPEGYQFLGTNQVVHKTLQDLVDYHETKPITSKGQECLLYPVGQQDPNNADYSNLFDQLPMVNGGYNGGFLPSPLYRSSPSLFAHR